MLVALIGVLGVLLGGLLSALFSYLLARRAEIHQSKTAARLVLPELLDNRSRLEAALRIKHWGLVEFRTQRWRQHELTIASGFGEEWRLLATVYTALMLLNEDRRDYEDDERIEFPDDLEYLRLASLNLDDAIAVLRGWAGFPGSDVLFLPGDERVRG